MAKKKARKAATTDKHGRRILTPENQARRYTVGPAAKPAPKPEPEPPAPEAEE